MNLSFHYVRINKYTTRQTFKIKTYLKFIMNQIVNKHIFIAVMNLNCIEANYRIIYIFAYRRKLYSMPCDKFFPQIGITVSIKN